jgi:hypothetical protein
MRFETVDEGDIGIERGESGVGRCMLAIRILVFSQDWCRRLMCLNTDRRGKYTRGRQLQRRGNKRPSGRRMYIHLEAIRIDDNELFESEL